MTSPKMLLAGAVCYIPDIIPHNTMVISAKLASDEWELAVKNDKSTVVSIRNTEKILIEAPVYRYIGTFDLDSLVALETRFVYYSKPGLYSKFLRYQKEEELTAITLHDFKELNVELNVVKISM